MYKINLIEKNPGYINLELEKYGKVETFCDTNISKKFLYQFGEDYVKLTCENTILFLKFNFDYNFTMKNPTNINYIKFSEYNLKVKGNQFYNIFSLIFLNGNLNKTFPRLLNGIKFNKKSKDLLKNLKIKFLIFLTGILNSNKIEDTKLFLERISGAYFNIIQFENKEGFFNAKTKLVSLEDDYKEFSEKIYLDGLYFKYIDKIDSFKTDENRKMLSIKQFQDKDEMKEFFEVIFNENFKKFIVRKNIDSIFFIPNNVVRKTSFNHFIFENLKNKFKEYSFYEIKLNEYKGREAQKSIRGLCNRIENAEKLFIFDEKFENTNNILLIDDVFGSGATMNTVAKKLKKQNPNVNIIGFSLLGSYRKGFDIINEI